MFHFLLHVQVGFRTVCSFSSAFPPSNQVPRMIRNTMTIPQYDNYYYRQGVNACFTNKNHIPGDTHPSPRNTILLQSASSFSSTHKDEGQSHHEQGKQQGNVNHPDQTSAAAAGDAIPIHLAEGICAVYKPIGWTSQDVVSYLRGMLERDARSRGAVLSKRRSKKSKLKVKVGHGGTLDPLATGVLVIGIGSGTKALQQYLQGSKKYRAGVELGFETDTLDMAGEKVKEMDWKHVVEDDIPSILLDQFTGNILQKPPLYSAIRKNGKRLYEQARKGMTEDDLEIEARPVEIYNIEYLPQDLEGNTMPCFGLDVECGGGTYIRSLVRDLGNALGTCATMKGLERTQQGPFTLEDALPKEKWDSETIYAQVEKWNLILSESTSMSIPTSTFNHDETSISSDASLAEE
jgi:tRNA pseudouridine 55 synthase